MTLEEAVRLLQGLIDDTRKVEEALRALERSGWPLEGQVAMLGALFSCEAVAIGLHADSSYKPRIAFMKRTWNDGMGGTQRMVTARDGAREGIAAPLQKLLQQWHIDDLKVLLERCQSGDHQWRSSAAGGEGKVCDICGLLKCPQCGVLGQSMWRAGVCQSCCIQEDQEKGS